MKFKGFMDNMNRRTRESVLGAVWLAPSVIGVAGFYIIPFLIVVYYSVINSPIQADFVFLDNFISLLGNTSFRTAAYNTARFSVVAVPLAVILSLGIALMLEVRMPMRSQFRTFFLSPLMVPVASVVLIWQVLFHPNGAVNDFVALFGVEGIDWMRSGLNQIVVVLLFLWKNLGFNMILFMAALCNIPRDVLETADVEGAGPIRKLFSIKMRYLSPTLLFVTIFSLINSFKVFREIYLLTGSYPYEGVYMLQHFMNNMFVSLNYQRLAAAAVIMTIVLVIIILTLFIAEDKFGKDVEE